jgi:hypothetical protein
MSEKSLHRPVMVTYMNDVEPDLLHPVGMSAGFTTESPTPAVAKAFHPNAMITRYADGGVYDDRAVRRELDAEGEAAKEAEAAKLESRAKRSTGRRRKELKEAASKVEVPLSEAEKGAEEARAQTEESVVLLPDEDGSLVASVVAE